VKTARHLGTPAAGWRGTAWTLPAVAGLLFAAACSDLTAPCEYERAEAASPIAPETLASGRGGRQLPAARKAAGSRGAPPEELFIDATRQAGLDFVHFNGVTGEYFLPEITGAGGALFDYDKDGDLDLYAVQGAKLWDRPSPSGFAWDGKAAPRDRLFRNELAGSGAPPRFTDVTEASGIRATGYGMGVAAGDYNNDGRLDLYVTNLGQNQLWRNNGDGTFDDVTAEAGAGDPAWSTSAAFLDYDGDGLLDLFAANYVNFSPAMKRECFASTSARDYCGPDAYDPVPDRLFRNRGDGVFEDVTAAAGLTASFGAGLGVIAADFNSDGQLDLYVANDGDPNQLWINQDGRRFEDQALLAGVALNHMGRPEASMGVDAADFDGDGDEDLFMTHLDGESNTLFVNQGGGFFSDETIRAGLHAASLPLTGFGTAFLDYDNDGWLDLFAVNGAVRLLEKLAREGEPYPLQQPNQLFRNTGAGSFADVSAQAGAAFTSAEVSRGAAVGDVDNDGDTDIVVFNNNGPARLLLNQSGNRAHWLGLRLIDPETGLDVTQARVEVMQKSGRSLWRRARAAGGYCTANDPRVIAGLGGEGAPCTVRVHWPHGGTEVWPDLTPGRYWKLVRGASPAAR